MKTKFIKKANAWLIAVDEISAKGKKGQKFNWFATKDEALAFITLKDNGETNNSI